MKNPRSLNRTKVFTTFADPCEFADALSRIESAGLFDVRISTLARASVMGVRVWEQDGSPETATRDMTPEGQSVPALDGSRSIIVSGPIVDVAKSTHADRQTIHDTLLRFGFPPYDARRASELLVAMGALLIVDCPDDETAAEVIEIMERSGGDYIGAAVAGPAD